ncbi:AlkA N-terminal domain-containing protein [Marisediminicola sp. LYQ134]|uniref:AlkA N-terminal domain-containing protein n=1 Tax=unclassified Marisediminicola TaxID=2618316 RepID=UPI0039838B57
MDDEDSSDAVVRDGDPRFEARFSAMASRDARFDGQFVTGVHSTGIYCRPSCPAITPLRRNVAFYRTVAGAHEAGLRACKRCGPDAVPGSPEWNLGDDIASRAMRLIADGTVDRDGVPGLAARLGYTPRHLTRVLDRELGAGPLAIARAHRAQSARALLVETDLAVTDVAFAAGFTSVRQFNDTMVAVFGRSPSEVRRAGGGGRSPGTEPHAGLGAAGGGTRPDAGLPGSTTITLRLPARAPFDGAGLLRFLSVHAIRGVETGDDRTFARRVRLPRGTAHVTLALAGDDAVSCVARLDDVADLSTLVARIRRVFDLDADSVAIDDALGADAALAPSVAASPGTRLPGGFDAHETLFRTLIGQQVSVTAATTVLGRVSAELCGDSGLFPTATDIAERGEGVIRGPASRVATILGVARALASGDLAVDVGMSTPDLVSRLTAMPGIGPWTAGYVAMRVLGAPDILLSSDLIMRKSAGELGLPDTERGLAAHGERWAPWRSYAGLHLWRSTGR